MTWWSMRVRSFTENSCSKYNHMFIVAIASRKASVPQRSEFLATDPEVPGLILDATKFSGK
jgi:hypothetical protein